MMKTLNVALDERSYPIYIGQNLLSRTDLLAPHIASRQVMIVTNETIAPLYLEQVRQLLGDFEVHQVVLPDGERYKNLDVLNRIFDALLQARCDRQCTLIALGGGVIGDTAGFAAACFQRGIPFIQIPTTLLSQVDSSVGGKTAVNHPHGKNMIGAFYQPRCVIADTNTLNTLDDRQLHSGLAEVIKYGLISDGDFFSWLEDNMAAILARDPAALQTVITRSCQNKADVVAMDEYEGGVRALLNLGHTFGHAIETHTGYESWLHGEAVATGMLMAADLSARLGWINDADVQRTKRLLQHAQLPDLPPSDMTPSDFLQHMAVDKKVQNKQIRLILLKAIGQSLITADFDPDCLKDTLGAFTQQSA